MIEIILAQNKQRAIDGLEVLSNNINILENSKVEYQIKSIHSYKNEIENSIEVLESEDVTMPMIDDILTFIDTVDKRIIDLFR